MLAGVGDLEKDTTVERIDADEQTARYRAALSAEWEIWGPMGGYVASVALRAAADASPFGRPASFFCQYLGVATFDDVEITVTTLRGARTAMAQRVQVHQRGREILEATVWSIGDVDGLAHDVSEGARPDVALPHELKKLDELLTDEQKAQGPPYPFWQNLESKPVRWLPERPETAEPVWQEWLRFTPTATFDDLWVDACRALILVDLQSWPSGSRPHAQGHGFIAPSLDLYVAFHDPQPTSEWLLADGHSPIAREGLMAWNGRLWSEGGNLVASGAGQMLCRRVTR